MSVLNMLPVPVIQMGLVEKLVEVEQNQAHVQQLVSQESAKLAMKAQAEQVPVVDVAEQNKKIRDRNSEREKKERRKAAGRSFRGRSAAQNDEDDDAAANEQAKANPWAGQIVNLKV
jgi:hypothetical protein